ncbi:MAG: YybH family protein [Myxococcota bacterium]
MRAKTMTGVWAAVLVLAAPAWAAQKEKTAQKEMEAIKATTAEFIKAHNRHDAAAMAAHWVEDGTFIHPDGKMAKGRAAIERLLSEEHASPMMKDCTATAEVKDLRLVRPDLAFVDLEMRVRGMKRPDGSPLPEQISHVSLLAEKKAGKWLVLDARPYYFVDLAAMGVGGAGEQPYQEEKPKEEPVQQ